VKQPRKRVVRKKTSEAPAELIAWTAWIRLGKTLESEAFSAGETPAIDELDWVRGEISKVVEVVDVRKPLQTRTTLPSIVYMASANRIDVIEQQLDEIRKQFPGVPIRFVLGQWWTGHRRSWPISAEISYAYWYQVHDTLFPELLTVKSISSESEPKPCSALVVADLSSTRQMWLDVLPTIGFNGLATADTAHLPEGNVDVVFLDQKGLETELNREQNAESSTEFDYDVEVDSNRVAVVRRAYPNATILVSIGFPRWQVVARCLENGADYIVGKPFQLEGIRSLLQQRCKLVH